GRKVGAGAPSNGEKVRVRTDRPMHRGSSQMVAVTVFVIDDNPDNLSLLASILRERRYQIRMTTTGRWALEAIRKSPPDLILLVISMPEIDGYAVCRELKAGSDTRDIPVIFISALDDVLDKVKAFRTGGVDYVTKPFEPEEVLARIENQLKIRSLQRDLERQNAELQKRNEERSEEHTSELQSRVDLVCRLLLEKKKDSNYQ